MKSYPDLFERLKRKYKEYCRYIINSNQLRMGTCCSSDLNQDGRKQQDGEFSLTEPNPTKQFGNIDQKKIQQGPQGEKGLKRTKSTPPPPSPSPQVPQIAFRPPLPPKLNQESHLPREKYPFKNELKDDRKNNFVSEVLPLKQGVEEFPSSVSTIAEKRQSLKPTPKSITWVTASEYQKKSAINYPKACDFSLNINKTYDPRPENPIEQETPRKLEDSFLRYELNEHSQIPVHPYPSFIIPEGPNIQKSR